MNSTLSTSVLTREEIALAADRFTAKATAKKHDTAGVDGITPSEFGLKRDAFVASTFEALKNGTFRPSPVLRLPAKNGKRVFGIPTVTDRVVQIALLNKMYGVISAEFADGVHGFVIGRGCPTALKSLKNHILDGRTFLFKTDISKCFNNLQHDILLEKLARHIDDHRIIHLVEQFLKTPDTDNLGGETTIGVHQGAPLSTLLCNVYLNDFDHTLDGDQFKLIRYVDDLIIACRTPEDSQQAHQLVQHHLENIGLTPHPEKTRHHDAHKIFNFLGYEIMKQDNHVRIAMTKSNKQRVIEGYARLFTREYRAGNLDKILPQIKSYIGGVWGHFATITVTHQLEDIDRKCRNIIINVVSRKDRRKIKKGVIQLPSFMQLYENRQSATENKYHYFIPDGYDPGFPYSEFSSLL